jgi:hypothetical protein
MLKSRELATGGQAIWKYNGNTGKLTHEEQEEEEVIWQTQTVQEAIKAQKNKPTQSSGE